MSCLTRGMPSRALRRSRLLSRVPLSRPNEAAQAESVGGLAITWSARWNYSGHTCAVSRRLLCDLDRIHEQNRCGAVCLSWIPDRPRASATSVTV